jgi:hypothetical protein
MVGLFKRKSKVVLLNEKYKKAMEESFHLSKTNRSLADKKYADADRILKQLEIEKSKE